MKYKFIPHTADVKFRAEGKTIEEAFKAASLALKETIIKDKKIKIKPKVKKSIKVHGKDNEALLYNFLEEFLFLLDAKNWILSSVKKIKIQDNKLGAEVSGDKASNYNFSNDVKAVTYNEMFVRKGKNKYIVQVVLDV